MRQRERQSYDWSPHRWSCYYDVTCADVKTTSTTVSEVMVELVTFTVPPATPTEIPEVEPAFALMVELTMLKNLEWSCP